MAIQHGVTYLGGKFVTELPSSGALYIGVSRLLVCRRCIRKARQGAQLSQRGRAMLRVVKNFAKSINVTQCHSKLHRWV